MRHFLNKLFNPFYIPKGNEWVIDAIMFYEDKKSTGEDSFGQSSGGNTLGVWQSYKGKQYRIVISSKNETL